jgi:hypothetical protein
VRRSQPTRRPGRPTAVRNAIAVAALALLAGCSRAPGADPPPTPTSSSSDVEPSPTESPTVVADGDPVVVGVLVGARLSDVRRALAPEGVRLDVRFRSRCGPGVVLSQRPAPGARVRPGGTIRVVVSRAPLAATCALPSAARAARRLEGWARGKEPLPELADQVRFLVANRPVRTVAAAQAADRDEWTLDVAYAERTDLRILDLLSTGPMADRDVPPFSCLVKDVALPRDLVRRLPSSWSLVTRRPRACLEEAAVQVWTDGAGRITDVNVLMGSP